MSVPATIGVSLPESLELSDSTALGQRAEELGYETAWVSETWGRDIVTTAALLSERTTTIDIGTSIMPTYSRSPALIGQTAATLQEASDGRLRLGLGPSGPAVIENWHGIDYGNPLRQLRETVEIVSQVLDGERLDYDGTYHTVSLFSLRSELPATRPPVEVAGIGPKAVELAGRFADGWHGTFLTRDGLSDRLETLNHGMNLGDREADSVTTMLVLNCCALDDGDRARELIRQETAIFVGAMGTFFRDALKGQGYETVATEIHEKWQAGNQGEAIAAVPEELVDEMHVVGEPEQAREQLEAFAELDGLDEISVQFPQNATASERAETLEALAPGQFD